jgi:hypothetical protein
MSIPFLYRDSPQTLLAGTAIALRPSVNFSDRSFVAPNQWPWKLLGGLPPPAAGQPKAQQTRTKQRHTGRLRGIDLQLKVA